MEQTINPSTTSSYYTSQMRSELRQGDWERLHKTASEWLQTEKDQPIATFVQNMACLFTNPPSMIRNKRYLETVGNKDWKDVLNWFKDFQGEADRHNPFFQTLGFILEPASKKKATIENSLQENPNVAELFFVQAISLREPSASIEKLKLALHAKPEFSAAAYLLGIFSLQLNQVQAAENYLKQAVEQAPDFIEAHYQLGSLYYSYIPDAREQARVHFQKVVELDPDGGAGRDAQKVLERGTRPQYGQRVSGEAGGRRSNTSLLIIVVLSLLTTMLFSGPIATYLKITNPIIGILAGLFVFIGLYSVMGRRKQ